MDEIDRGIVRTVDFDGCDYFRQFLVPSVVDVALQNRVKPVTGQFCGGR
jgi:hypothetical protein